MDSYNEAELRGRVDAALKRIRTLLDNTRNPRYAGDVPHRYVDKYHLAEFLGRATVAALVQCLRNIGLSPEGLTRLRGEALSRAVTLRLRAQEDCRFLREEVRKVETGPERVVERRGLLGTSTRTEKVLTTVTEHVWSFEFDYELLAFVGNQQDQPLPLLGRRGKIEFATAAGTTPRPQAVVRPALDVNLTWLLQHLDAQGRATFSIDRTLPGCHTPRRNSEVHQALHALGELHGWCSQVRRYFLSDLFPAQPECGLDLSAIHDNDVFVPVVPLFESAAQGNDGPVPYAHLEAFLDEQQRSLSGKCLELTRVFPRDASVITAVEAGLLVIVQHTGRLCQQFSHGVDYLEQLLQQQLVAAIGKELTPADFTRYMDFHHRKLVKPAYHPLPFSHAVRRPEHDPEGVLSLEADRGASRPDPVLTTVVRSEATRPMYFALDASTRVAFLGERLLHGWLCHQFSGAPAPSLTLVARARQFSSFVLLVGRIASAEVFEPTFGIIVQNKDLLKIPVLLETIPTPKEFRDAIESLSPEQQRFAKAYRSMQLESTLFGVCVIQIKPQLEKLLRLPPDSLTKEIMLTQELSELFIEHQIPSDILSYDGPADAPAAEKLELVKAYTGRMREMIAYSKQREIDDAQEREALRLAEANRSAPQYLAPGPVPTGASFGFEGGPPLGAMPGAMPMPMAPPMAQGAAPRMPSPGPVPRPAAARPSSAPAAARPPPAPAPVAAPPAAAPPVAPRQPAEPAAPAAVASTPRPVTHGEEASGSVPAEGAVLDYTKIPAELDRRFDQLDEDGALRPTILNPGDGWTRTSQKGLLASPVTSTLAEKDQKAEKNKAFDLLDALTKSGALTVDHASLHVVLAATHRFDRTLVDTVIQGNVNPIEKVERSLMIVATTLHRQPAAELLAEDQRERFLTYAPRLGAASEARQLGAQGEGEGSGT